MGAALTAIAVTLIESAKAHKVNFFIVGFSPLKHYVLEMGGERHHPSP